MSERDNNQSPDRRKFIQIISSWAAAGAALFVLPHCGTMVEWESEEDDFGMYGPIQQATYWLNKPLETEALPLLTPFNQGQVFADRWAFAHAARGSQEQLVLIAVDIQTGGHLELHLFNTGGPARPLAYSRNYDLILHDGGTGQNDTPLHIRKLASNLSDLLRTNERSVALSWDLPALSPNTPFIEPFNEGLVSAPLPNAPGDLQELPNED
jgi:hypothetical protein